MTCKYNCVMGGDTLKNHQAFTENTRLLTENITLRQQISEKYAEIEQLTHHRNNLQALLHARNRELAASQAREQQLREALHSCYSDWDGNKQVQHFNIGLVYEALSIPQDTSALEAIIAKAVEVTRDRCAVECETHYNFSKALAAAIRALPAVTLDDLK